MKGNGKGRPSNTSVRHRRARCAYQVLLCLVIAGSCVAEGQKDMPVAAAVEIALVEMEAVPTEARLGR